ncbi:putative ubiquitin-specific protease 2B [Trifolium repens]|nr:putative ubiquitin-specific protease 2B [Trifolium repens]
MTMMNEFPSRVLESLDSMDAFDDSSSIFQLHEFLVDGAIDNFNMETYVDTLRNTLGNSLGDYIENFEFEAVKLSNSTNSENRQQQNSVEQPDTEDTSGGVSLLQSNQTESVCINLEDDECVNYSTPSSSASDIAADTTFSDFQEPFDEFVYPKGDPDAVCLSKRDVDLLQPDTYINDTIIDFYILYLKNKIQEQEKARFHFFNSFFFRKLAGMDKNAPYACDGKSAFQSVRKWTRKVNLFEKDYIFIPVNFNHHWSLIVICHPGEVVNINDTEPEKSLRLPCILHMDSIKGYHSGLKDLVQSYLCVEWKERKKDTCGEDLSSRFLNMRFLAAEVPQQENTYDCGLFLLHNLELFLAEAPLNFNPLRITNFLNLNWFPPAEAYLKRTFIRRLIFELVENHGSLEGFSPDNSDDYLCSEYNHNRIGGQCHLINGEPSTSHSGRGIELDPPLNTSSMVLQEHFEPGATLGTSLRHCQYFDQLSSNHCSNGSISTMEKDTDLSEHLQAEHLKADSSLDTSSCATNVSDDIEIIEYFPVKNRSRSSDDIEIIEYFPVKKKSRSYPMSVENIQHLYYNFLSC